MSSCPRIVIAGIRGGSGKTTVTLSVIAGLRARGLAVAPFKKGPDYIDAGWLSKAADRPCYNLDPFLVSRGRVLDSFVSHFNGDLAVIEGNRGLFDGMDAGGAFSTAELAKLLKAPVLLVVDCTKMTRTVAAVVQGCMNFDLDLRVAGVVLNQIAGSRHETIARQAVETYCGLPVAGAIPRLKGGEMPERHMGLTPHQEHDDVSKALAFAGSIAKKYLDIDKIIAIAGGSDELSVTSVESRPSIESSPVRHSPQPLVRIGVFRDAAFQFYYPENFEELERAGARIVEINALDGETLPDIDALYIGGGFPETNALRLAQNEPFRRAVKEAAGEGMPIYAECGGLMFLGREIVVDGSRYPMAGVFPLVFEMRKKPQAHGYTIVRVDRDNPFYPAGTLLHGHEFHYSAVNEAPDAEGIGYAFSMERGHGIKDGRDGITYRNVLGTYTHIHALGAPEWAPGLVARAIDYKANSKLKEQKAK